MPAIITTRYEQVQAVEEARAATVAHLGASQATRAATATPPTPALRVTDAQGTRKRVRRFGEPFNAANADGGIVIAPVPTTPPVVTPPAPRSTPQRYKTLPDFEVLAYPSDGLPRILVEPFAGQDVLASLIKNQSGETTPISTLTPGDISEADTVAQWDGQSNFLALSDALRFVRVSAKDSDEGSKEGARAAAAPDAASSAQIGSDLSGFSVRRLSIPLHFQMDTWDATRDPSGAPPIQRGYYHAFRPVIWHAGRGMLRSATAPDGSPLARKVYDLRGDLSKAPSHWETVVDASHPRRQRVFHSSQAPDDVVWVQTDNWEENLGFELDFTDLQVARGQQGQARIRIEWGKVFSVVLRDGAAPTFEKRLPSSKAAGTPKTTTPDKSLPPGWHPPMTLPNDFANAGKAGEIKPDPKWKTVSELTGAGTVDWSKTKRIGVSVERVAGRFRVSVRFGDAAPIVADITDRRVAPTAVGAPPADEAVPASWPRAPLRASFGGVSAHMGGAELRALDERTGAAISARFGRKLRAPGAHDAAAARSNGIEANLYATGWGRDGTGVSFPAAEIYQREVGRGLFERALAYVCELRASTDGKDVPLLTTVAYSWGGANAPIEQRQPLDITPACVGSARISTGQPPDVPTADLSLKVDHVLLQQLLTSGDAAAGATHRDYVSKYNRIVVRARWNYSDNTQDEYSTLFDGAIYSPARNTARILQQDWSLTCRDRVMRCSSPWAFVDSKYRAGHFLLFEKVNQAIKRAGSGAAFAFFGAELIHDILRITFGDEVANSLNGGIDTGNPSARANGLLRYFPRLTAPLMESGYDVLGLIALQGPLDNQGRSIPTVGNGLMFPPPYKQAVIQWLQQIAALEQAVFYWGWPPGIEVESPVPIYGRITEITKAARALGVYEIPDCNYGGEGDIDRAMMSVESRLLVERDITRVVTYAGQAGDASGLIPAIASGEARFDPGPANDPQNGGERTLVQENDALLLAGLLTGGPEGLNQFLGGLSELTLNQYAGVSQEDISIAMRGDAALRWGREIRPQMSADGGFTSGGVGDYSFDAMDLHDKPYHVQRVEHSLSFAPSGGEGGGAWDMNVSARPISADGL